MFGTIREERRDEVEFKPEGEKQVETRPARKVVSIDRVRKGRPVLVGTVSIEKSERLATACSSKRGIPHEVLNAKHHKREAEIVSQAGRK